MAMEVVSLPPLPRRPSVGLVELVGPRLRLSKVHPLFASLVVLPPRLRIGRKAKGRLGRARTTYMGGKEVVGQAGPRQSQRKLLNVPALLPPPPFALPCNAHVYVACV